MPTTAIEKRLEVTPGRGNGRLKRIEHLIAEIEVKLGRNADPVQTLIELAAGHDALAEREVERLHLDPESDQARLMATVPLEVRLDAAKAAARYCRPMLQQVAVTDPNGGPVQLALPMSELMRNPDAVRAIEDLQIVIATRRVTEITQERFTLLPTQEEQHGRTLDRCPDQYDSGENR